MTGKVKSGRGLITRIRADNVIDRVVAEAQAINDDPTMIHWVTEVVVFGSYLGEKPVLGDLDLAVALSGRWRDSDEAAAMEARFERDHPPPAYIADVFINRLFWGQTYTRRRLKVGRGISLHDRGELNILKCPFRVIFERQPF